MGREIGIEIGVCGDDHQLVGAGVLQDRFVSGGEVLDYQPPSSSAS